MCNTCALCLEQFNGNGTIATMCNHRFHKSCFFELTIKNRHTKCPMCRKRFEEEWFMNLKDELQEIGELNGTQQFANKWKWWCDYFQNVENENDSDNEQEFNLEPNEDWVEFLQLPEDEDLNEMYNYGNRPRVDVNPELVIWEGEIEDLFEEVEIIQENRMEENGNEGMEEIDGNSDEEVSVDGN